MSNGPWWNRQPNYTATKATKAAKNTEDPASPKRRVPKTREERERDRKLWRSRLLTVAKGGGRETDSAEALVPVRHRTKSGITLAGRNHASS